MKKLVSTLTLVLSLSLAAHASAEETYTVALFVPSLNFADGVARNDYISEVAEDLEDATDLDWVGRAYARQSDFEAALRKDVDLAIIDGEYFAAKGGSLTAVASLKAKGETSLKMSLVASNADTISELKGKTLVLPKAGGYSKRLISADALGGEVDADDFFADIDYVKDVRSAINAVSLGKADATLVFSKYKGGLNELYTTSKAPLPVIAIVSSRVSGDLAGTVKKAAKSISVSGASLVNGAGSYSSDSVKKYKNAANKKKKRLSPDVRQPRSLEMTPGKFPRSSDDARLKTASGGERFLLPPIEDLNLHPELEQ